MWKTHDGFGVASNTNCKPRAYQPAVDARRMQVDVPELGSRQPLCLCLVSSTTKLELVGVRGAPPPLVTWWLHGGLQCAGGGGQRPSGLSAVWVAVHPATDHRQLKPLLQQRFKFEKNLMAVSMFERLIHTRETPSSILRPSPSSGPRMLRGLSGHCFCTRGINLPRKGSQTTPCALVSGTPQNQMIFFHKTRWGVRGGPIRPSVLLALIFQELFFVLYHGGWRRRPYALPPPH